MRSTASSLRHSHYSKKQKEKRRKKCNIGCPHLEHNDDDDDDDDGEEKLLFLPLVLSLALHVPTGGEKEK